MIHLINDLYLDTNTWNYILKKRVISQSGKTKGEERFEVEGYFGKNLKMLKHAIVNDYIFQNITNMKLNDIVNQMDIMIEKLEEIKG